MTQNTELNIGIVGCGMISRYHARAIHDTDGITLAGCCSHSLKSAERFAEEFSVPVFSDYQAMLASKEIHAVAICTPSGDHAEQILSALAAGKHVVVEKPMCLTLAEADAVVKKAAESGLTVCVISQSRFSEAAMELKRAIDAGEFGKMVSASLMMRYYRSPEYYNQAEWRGTIAGDGGGVLMNQGIHGIDLLCHLMGTPVSACGYVDTLLRDIEVEDTAVGCVRFANGAVASIDATVCSQPAFSKTFLFCGEKGVVQMVEDSITMWTLPTPCGVPVGNADTGSGAADPSGITYDNHAKQYADFVQAVLKHKKPLVDEIEGRMPLRVIHGIYSSSKTGQSILLESNQN